MGCPFNGSRVTFMETAEEDAQAGTNKVALGQGVTYGQYLQLDKLLDCQKLLSEEQGNRVNDEHLFIIIHQSYELWFKQIIFDIDIVRMLLNHTIVDETKTLRIVSGLDRTVRILKLLVDQITILDTMSPLDFVDFRKYLTPASGFQSLQFRLIENKMGVRLDRRIKYNAQHYKNVFLKKVDQQAVEESEHEPSLLMLIQNWLERTPGLKETVIDGVVDEGFWTKYERAVERYLSDLYDEAMKETLPQNVHDQLLAEYYKTKDSFATILDQNNIATAKSSTISDRNHKIGNNLDCSTRLLSHDAMKGALMIYFYRDMPRFSQPYQILTYLMDIDSLFTKWRYNHVILVQRMLGSKQGTGGSSGYMYLRSTVSDKYKVFLDLFNLSTWLIPREYIPTLSPRMVKTLSEHSNLTSNMLSETE